MLVNKFILRAAGAGLAAIVSLAAQPLKAQASSDADRLEKLERAVQALQQRNAQLESEISGLKKQRNAFAAQPAPEGKMKTVSTTDGKKYVEKLVPDLGRPKNGNCSRRSLNWSSTVTCVCDTNIAVADFPVTIQIIPTTGRSCERERYRLRIGLRGTLLDDWFFGVRLETSASARSTNVTFGDDTSTTSPGGGGPFAKGSDGIYVGQAYGGYKGFPGFTFTGGRMPNPFVTTLMVWDDDINPEGLAEQWKHTFAIGGGEAAPASYSKDGKAVCGAPGGAIPENRRLRELWPVRLRRYQPVKPNWPNSNSDAANRR